MSGLSSAPNQAVSELFIEYRNNNFVADIIAPVKTAVTSELFYYRNRGSHAQEDIDLEVSDLGNPVVVSTTMDKQTLSLKNYAIVDRLPVNSQSESELISRGGIKSTIQSLLVDRLLVQREVAVAATFTNTSNFSGFTASPSTKWGTASVKQVRTDVDTAMDAIVGVQPQDSILLMGLDAFRALTQNTNVLAQFQYTAPNAISEDQVAGLLGVGKVVVARAKKTSNLNSASPTSSFIWGDHCVLFKQADPSAAPMATGLALTFREEIMGYGLGIYDWIDTLPGVAGAHIIKASFAEKAEMIGPRFGYLLSDCVA